MTARSPHIVISWVLQLLVAGILVQTLFFKFTGAEESVYIFRKVGAEPWGRIGSGIIELVASMLLLVPSTIPIGALLVFATMSGAILSHLTVLGIEVKGDGGLLFGLALGAPPGAPVPGRRFNHGGESVQRTPPSRAGKAGWGSPGPYWRGPGLDARRSATAEAT